MCHNFSDMCHSFSAMCHSFSDICHSFSDMCQQVDEEDVEDSEMYIQEAVSHCKPSLTVQSIKSAPLDAEAHVLLFDTEALIIQLLCDEFGLPSYSQLPSNKSSAKLHVEIEQKITG